MRGAVIGAARYEGLADDDDAVDRLFEWGELRLEPCHHHHAVGPMAGVVSSSMPAVVVKDEHSERVAHCTLNEGLGKVLRYGAYDNEVLERLSWMKRVLAPLLSKALERHGPVDLVALTAQALQMGDEGHNRNRAGTSLFVRTIAADLVE